MERLDAGGEGFRRVSQSVWSPEFVSGGGTLTTTGLWPAGAPVPECPICRSRSGMLHRVRDGRYAADLSGSAEPAGIPTPDTSVVMNDAVGVVFECGLCGCLQLQEAPEAGGEPRYWRARQEFYRIQQYLAPAERVPFPPLRGMFEDTDTLWAAAGAPAADRKATTSRPRRRRATGSGVIDWIAPFLAGVASPRPETTRVLDIGCGNGTLLRGLADAGFRHLVGIDPTLPADRRPHPSIQLKACTPEALARGTKTPRFDLVLISHTLERIEDQHGLARAVAALLAPGGICRIETPIADSAPFQEYGADWVEADPYRNRIVHTRHSLALLFAPAGLAIQSAESVGVPMDFWGSDVIRAGVGLYDTRFGTWRSPATMFTPEEIAAFGRRSQEANASHRGGRAIFVLRHASAVDGTDGGAR